eukprot:jgi/Orpsp1_1/1186359/evm.model.d7180000049970.1
MIKLVSLEYVIGVSWIRNKDDVYNHVNNNGENALIIAAKLGHISYIKNQNFNKFNINQQDHLGNTALYYTIKINDYYAVNILSYYHADPNIKNHQNVSAFDLTVESNNEEIIKILKKPVPPREMEARLKNKDKKFLFIKKKKTTDEKVEDYIQNYQIKNYKNDYQYLMKYQSNYDFLINESNLLNVIIQEKLLL